MLDTRKSLDVFSVSTMMVLCLLWGGQQVLIKLAAPQLDPLMQLTIRYAISALILGVTCGIARVPGCSAITPSARVSWSESW